ncbi:MAG: hypothetical protein ACK4KV_23195 [Rhodocyclaceae bacterium]
MIGDHAVELAVAHHRGRGVGVVGVEEDALDAPVRAEFGNRVEGVLVQQAVLQGAVFLLADAPPLRVDDVVDAGAAGQCDLVQTAERVVGVGGGAGRVGAALQVAGRGVGVIVVAPCGEAVFRVVAGDLGAVFTGAVAVGVEGPLGARAVDVVGSEAAGS